MNNYIRKKLEKVSDIQYILLAVVISFLIQLSLQLLINLYEEYAGSVNLDYIQGSEIFMLIIGCILGPILESLFIVFFIWVLKNKFHIKKKSKLFLISVIIFTLLHYYSGVYIILVLPNCLIIIYSYLYYRPKRLSSFKVMLLVHSLMNVYGVLMGKL